MVGWRITKEGEYRINLPILSDEEEKIIDEVIEIFADMASEEEMSDPERAHRRMKDILLQHLRDIRLKASEDQVGYLTEVLFEEIYRFGPLSRLLDDDDLEEIAVIGLGKPVYVFHRSKGWMETNLIYKEREALIEVINKMARSIGRRITLQNPRLNAVLPDGSRLHASMEPVSSLEVTIRKFRKRPFTIKDLYEKAGYSPELLAFLWLVFESDKNVVICGNTAAGKTTTLNALFEFVPLNERVILLEETPEISIPHKHQVRMRTEAGLGITMKDLIEDSLRMRPDRVIIGEVRSADEIRAMIESMNAGQARGCYATMHAQSAKELVARLRYNDIPPSDIVAIDLIIVQRRFLKFDKGKMREMRRVIEVCEPVEGRNGIGLQHIFKYDPAKGYAVRTRVKSKILEDLAFMNNTDVEAIEKEIEKRAKTLLNRFAKG